MSTSELTEKTLATLSERIAKSDAARRDHRLLLEEKYGTGKNPKAETLYEMAWQYGHGIGFEEIELLYKEMLILIANEVDVGQITKIYLDAIKGIDKDEMSDLEVANCIINGDCEDYDSLVGAVTVRKLCRYISTLVSIIVELTGVEIE